MLIEKTKKMKPIDTAGPHQEIAEDQVNAGTVWLKKCDQNFRLNTQMEGPININESGRTENEAVMLDCEVTREMKIRTF